MALKIAINGLGRIGRCVAKIVASRDDMELVAINDTAPNDMIVYNPKYDSVHGVYNDVKIEDNYLYIKDEKAKIFSTRDLNEIDFASCKADVVIECTGVFLTQEKVQPFLDNGIKKVVFSAPAKDDTATFVMGVNEDKYANQSVVSNASCTTNGLAPVVKALDDAFGIEAGLMTTIHSYTGSQPILDAKHKKDPRKARSGAVNLVPTTTGAAKAIGKVLPHLNGKLNGQAIRVPTPNVSMVDLTVTLKKDTTVQEVNKALEDASNSYLKGILEVDKEYRVSSDFNGYDVSSIVPADTTQVIDRNLVKVLAWYDNEWGYSQRLVDLTKYISKRDIK